MGLTEIDLECGGRQSTDRQRDDDDDYDGPTKAREIWVLRGVGGMASVVTNCLLIVVPVLWVKQVNRIEISFPWSANYYASQCAKAFKMDHCDWTSSSSYTRLASAASANKWLIPVKQRIIE